MSNSKLQKCLFDSATQLKLKDLKYDSNPSVHCRLFQSFYNQLVSVLSSVESFDGVLLNDYEVHPFVDTNGTPNKALFRLLLTYVDMHYKTIIRIPVGSVTSPALQAQCASLTSAEQNNTHRDFAGIRIASRESLSSYLHCFLMARDKAETARNEYTNDSLLDFIFISSLGTDNTAYYSILCTTLENQRADGQIIPFVDMELKFIQLEEQHTSSASSCQERVNLGAPNPNPLAASNCHNGKTQPWGTTKFGNPKKSHITTSSNSSNDSRPIVCFGCNKPGHKKYECPERKEGNTANVGPAWGQPVAMATQEVHYASMAQVVKLPPQGSSVMRDPKKLWSMVVFQALVVPSAWMTNYHHQRKDGAKEWLNLFKVSMPADTSSGPPVLANHFMTLHSFHRDVVSEFTLNTQAVVSDFDLKTWGFLLYPDSSDNHNPDFNVHLQQILKLGTYL
jgi:hypothetical protein